MKDIISGTFIIVLSLLFKTQPIRDASMENMAGSGFWPNIILNLLIATGVFILIHGIFSFKGKNGTGRVSLTMPNGVRIKLLPIILCLIIYMIAVKYIGFLIATPLFQAVFLYIMMRKRKLLLVWLPLLLTSSLFIVFVKGMYVVLPRGIGVFRDFSNLFY